MFSLTLTGQEGLRDLLWGISFISPFSFWLAHTRWIYTSPSSSSSSSSHFFADLLQRILWHCFYFTHLLTLSFLSFPQFGLYYLLVIIWSSNVTSLRKESASSGFWLIFSPLLKGKFPCQKKSCKFLLLLLLFSWLFRSATCVKENKLDWRLCVWPPCV